MSTALSASLMRIAQLQQNPIDRNALMQAIDEVSKSSPTKVKQTLGKITRILMLPSPRWQRKPDPDNMPLLAHHTTTGWFIVRGQNAHEQWVIETWSDEHQKFVESTSDLPAQDATDLAKLSLNQPFEASNGPVYSLVKKQLLLNPSRLFEIMLATVTINLLALGASLYSMQIYNRVIPTNATQTLIVLTMGVLIAMVIEHLMKHARSSLYDLLIDTVDQSLSRSVFMRLLAVRLDQMPASVGSLAAQMNAYQTVRSFLTTATTNLLVDAPFVVIFLVLIGLVGHPLLCAVPLVFFFIALVIGIWHRKSIENLTNQASALSNFKTGIF
jgi:ATP-binding cassette subfamily C protein LapB